MFGCLKKGKKVTAKWCELLRIGAKWCEKPELLAPISRFQPQDNLIWCR
jgi:hypothetical protein